jgi:hypothetical protein
MAYIRHATPGKIAQAAGFVFTAVLSRVPSLFIAD